MNAKVSKNNKLITQYDVERGKRNHKGCRQRKIEEGQGRIYSMKSPSSFALKDPSIKKRSSSSRCTCGGEGLRCPPRRSKPFRRDGS